MLEVLVKTSSVRGSSVAGAVVNRAFTRFVAGVGGGSLTPDRHPPAESGGKARAGDRQTSRTSLSTELPTLGLLPALVPV